MMVAIAPRAAVACLIFALAAAVMLPGVAGGSVAPAATRWAVLIEDNSFRGRYPDLPVGYVNSTRMLTTLARRGWPADHMLLLRDVLADAGLADAMQWLADRARPGDTALLYVAGEYQVFARELRWTLQMPALWKRVPTAHRVLVVETCFAERLTSAVEPVAGLGLPAVGREEWDWWGLRQSAALIRGGAFTYFLTRALEAQPQGAPDFPAAFSGAVDHVRAYFRQVVATTPGALDAFHSRGTFPERLAAFPNPHLSVGPLEGIPAMSVDP